VQHSRRIAAITPLYVVCRTETWQQIVRHTTFTVPDSDWIVSPFKDLVPQPRADGLVQV
jgi:hypothetical protein